MKKYQILVVMSYWNELTVEAETQDEADEKAFELFDLNKAWQGEGEIYSSEEWGEDPQDLELREGDKE